LFAVEVSQCFDDCKDFYFRNQIKRAAVSVSDNIAEGFSRKSNKELRRFLNISIGSCNEVKSMVYLSIRLGFTQKVRNAADARHRH